MKWIIVLAGVLAMQAAADTAHVDFDLGLVFPQQLGGMACDTVENYDNDDLGYSVFYSRGTEFQVEVSVLTMGRPEIADGHKADGVQMMFQSVEMLMNKEQKGGIIENLKKRGSLVVPKKSPLQFANTVFQYSQIKDTDGASVSVPRFNSVYVTGAHNNFIKVQFRFDVAKGKEARVMADQLVKQLVLMLIAKNSEDDLILAACDALVNNPADFSGRSAAQRVFAKSQTFGELNIYDALFVWPQNYSKPKNADLLMAAYFAGMLKVVIPGELEHGGEFEAFVSMLKAYENMRTREQINAITELEEWMKNPDKKALYQKLLVDFGYVAP
ncbi:hypothetical protein P4B35_02595 [Pontiellaceae bacterium B12227]|nr:hypothetical protein [Pontiellaceae bacterium B12227]